MAQNLAASQHDQIRDMIVGQSLTNQEMADVAGCSIRTIKSIRANLSSVVPKRPATAVDGLDP